MEDGGGHTGVLVTAFVVDRAESVVVFVFMHAVDR